LSKAAIEPILKHNNGQVKSLFKDPVISLAIYEAGTRFGRHRPNLCADVVIRTLGLVLD